MTDSSWAELAQIYDVPPSCPTYAVVKVALDPCENLIWVAYANGRITSYLLSQPITKYTSFIAHEDPIVDMVVSTHGVISVSMVKVRFTTREGLVKAQIDGRSGNYSFSGACLPTLDSVFVYVSDSRGKGLILDLEKGLTKHKFGLENGVMCIRCHKQLMTVASTHCVRIRDPQNLVTLKTITLPPFCNLATTFSDSKVFAAAHRHPVGVPQKVTTEPNVLVYDTTSNESAQPQGLYFQGAPELLATMQGHPSLDLVVADRRGAFCFYNSTARRPELSTGPAYQLNVSAYTNVTCVDTALTGEVVVFGDTSGFVHIWSNSPTPNLVSEGWAMARIIPLTQPLCEVSPLEQCPQHQHPAPLPPGDVLREHWPLLDDHSIPLVLPYPPNISPPSSDIDSDVPLSYVGLPHYDQPLLSSWSPQSVFTVGKRPPPIDPILLSKAKWNDFVGYAPNLRTHRRNQVVIDKPAGADVPKFRSQQKLENKGQHTSRDSSFSDAKGTMKVPSGFKDSTTQISITMPNHLKRVEIRYSKFGVEDFDFAFYNQTGLSGLETDIINSYCNPLLQALFYIPILKQLAQFHFTLPSSQDECLLCEFGFLTRSLEDAQGTNCHASNLLQALGSFPQASALGLLEPEIPKEDTNFGAMIQNVTRFMLRQFDHEWQLPTASIPAVTLPQGLWINPDETQPLLRPSGSPLQQLFTWDIKVISTCPNDHANERQLQPFVLDLVYPRTSSSTGGIVYGWRPPTDTGSHKPLGVLVGGPRTQFTEVFHATVEPQQSMRLWCNQCTQYQIQQQVKRCTVVPPVIVLNCAIKLTDDATFWAGQQGRWLPPRLAISIQEGLDIKPLPGQTPETAESTLPLHFKTYRVVAIISEVKEEGKPGHLVAHIQCQDKKDTSPQWYVFNNFLVRKTTEAEVFQFGVPWRTPTTVILSREGIDVEAAEELARLPCQLNPHVLITSPQPGRETQAVTVTPEELPFTKGTLCALDGEFVMVDKAQFEVRSDGTRSIIRPNRLSLARVSVVHCQGPHCYQPFIDDYVKTTVPVVDYLTTYSGIADGDLQPTTSRKHLLSRKTVYKKLRYLVDAGCVFVGHGLTKDLRTINITVPPDQIIDTANIYRFEDRGRYISLKFLAWCVLGQSIQQLSHSSVQDAVASLRLYEEWRRLDADGNFESTLEHVYSVGQQMKWKPPNDG
ncbi:poly(A)-specific ribonuclease [Dispira simplex]|nr:poly(A)-specific ribonuclease [Dispira simplex]